MGKKKQKRNISTTNTPQTSNQSNNPTFQSNTEYDLIEKIGSNTKWLLLGLILFISFIVFSDFILLQKVYFFKDIGSDTLNGTLPIISHNSRYLEQYGFPTWSFEMGMGQNVFPFFFYDPLDLLLYPLGIEKMQYLIAFKLIFEIALSGISFFYFLQLLKLNKYTSLLGSLAYSFSGFMIVSSGWYIFPAEVITLPIILIGIEMIMQKKKYWILPIPIFYLVLTRPFVLAPLSIFILSYIVFRHTQIQKIHFKKLISQLIIVALISSIGVIMAMPFLLEHLKLMIESPRGSGANSLTQQLISTPIFKFTDKIELLTSFYRSFASDILGSGNDFKGWMNIFEAPQFYSGIITLVLMPHLFYLSTKRERIIFGGFLLFWLIPVFFPFVRYAFAFFTGDYYRSLSLYVSFAFIIIAMFGIEKIQNSHLFNKTLLFIWGLILVIFLIYPFFGDQNVKSNGIVFMVILCIAIYSFLLYRFSKKDLNSKHLIIILLVVELIILSYTSINNRDIVTSKELEARTGYNDYTKEAITIIKNQDSGFYRVDKRYASTPAMHSSLNDGMIQGYFSTSAYNSFNQKYYIQYLKLMGIIPENNESLTRWSQGLRSRMLLEGINSVKYLLAYQNEVDPMTRLLYDSIGISNNIVVLKNKYSLPLGFVYSKIFPKKEFQNLSNLNKDFVSYNAAIVDENDLMNLNEYPVFSLKDTLTDQSFTLSILDSLHKNLQSGGFEITHFKPSEIKGSIQLQKPGIFYFSIPFDKGWQIMVDNKKSEPIILSDGMTGIKLDEGKHEIHLQYFLPYAGIGLKISIIGFIAFGFIIWYSFKKRKNDFTTNSESSTPTSSTT